MGRMFHGINIAGKIDLRIEGFSGQVLTFTKNAIVPRAAMEVTVEDATGRSLKIQVPESLIRQAAQMLVSGGHVPAQIVRPSIYTPPPPGLNLADDVEFRWGRFKGWWQRKFKRAAHGMARPTNWGSE